MQPMRRILPRPTLRMQDGGVITRWAQNIMRPTQARLRAADAPTPVAAPVAAAPPVQTAAPVTPDNPAGIRFANGGDLRTGQGGHVPGSGSGDKIDAKYEPGEFVVSNDMLDNAPGLREQLHGLRGKVLAAKGMTPAEADAKAISGGLRARMGYDSLGNLTGAEDEDSPIPRGGAGDNFTGGANRSGIARVPSGAAGPVAVPQSDTNAVLQEGGRDIGEALRSGKFGKAAGSGLRTGLAVPVALAADTFNILKQGTYDRLRGPVEDVGRAALGMEDRQPIASPNASTASPAAAPPVAAPVTAPSNTLMTGDATMPGQDPGRGPMLRGQSGTDMGNGISKFTQNGKTLYSNVTGPDNDKLMSNKPGVSVVPGMSRQAIDAALGGMSAGQVSSDNAIRAANLRDGVDMERGTQGGKAARDEQQLQDLALSPAGTNGRTFAQKQLGLRMADATTRRSQDITERGNIMQNDTTLRNNRATRDAAALNALREQGNSDRTFGAGRDDARFTQSEKAEKDFTESILQAHTSTVDGKPVIDQNGAKQTRQAFDTMIAKQIQDLQRSGSPEDLARAKNLADNKINAVDPATRQKVIAAVRLMNKVGVDGSNLNPFKPDHMGTSDPRDFMDLKKNKSGDYETKTGKVIPARYFATQGADRFGGVPTNEFDILKGQ